MRDKKILFVIPARGNSKGIPRKNLRSLGGKPLIYYSIMNAKSFENKFDVDIFVSSEDSEIITISQSLGAKIHKRKQSLSKDETGLDAVIIDCVNFAENDLEKKYDLVVTLQPTSPLLEKESISEAIKNFCTDKSCDTIISATESTHLTWKKEKNKFTPNYKKRVNRQLLPKRYQETGGFVISARKNLRKGTRLGKKINLHLLEGKESIDIDTFSDWNLCEYFLKRKRMVILVEGYSEIGLGHIYNSLILASSIMNHEIVFLLSKKSILGYQKIKEYNYPAYLYDDMLHEVQKHNPDVIINDRLDTNISEMKKLQKITKKIINFEDLGSGSSIAMMTFNAIYTEQIKRKNNFFGSKYFILRDEFIYQKNKIIDNDVKNILIIFGGTDPNNLTLRVRNLIAKFCKSNKIKITIIAGLGYKNLSSLKKSNDIKIFKDVSNISKHIHNADLIFTSGGRTTYEIASIGTPAIVICHNKKELKHQFASNQNGFKNLGLHSKVSDDKILEALNDLCFSLNKRKLANKRMLKNKLSNGKENVIKLISRMINE